MTNVANTQSQVHASKKKNKISILADSKGLLRKDNCYQSPRQSEYFLSLQGDFFEKYRVLRFDVNSTLRFKIFQKVRKCFFLKNSFLVVYKVIFARRACALKEELPPFSIHWIWLTFFSFICEHIFRSKYSLFVANTHFRSKYPRSVFGDNYQFLTFMR